MRYLMLYRVVEIQYFKLTRNDDIVKTNTFLLEIMFVIQTCNLACSSYDRNVRLSFEENRPLFRGKRVVLAQNSLHSTDRFMKLSGWYMQLLSKPF